MTDTSIDFSIYNMLRIRGNNLPPHLTAALQADYRHLTQPVSDSGVELTIKPLAELELPASLFKKRKSSMERHYILEHEHKLYAVSLHRGNPDCIMSMQSPYNIYFTDRKGCANAVLDMLFVGVDIVLRETSEALLCKGAVVVRNGNATVLTGMSGAGKTSILLHLLHEGWDYLSDNTFILQEGNALCFRRHLVMHRYHIQKFSALYQTAKKENPVKSLLRRSLTHLLPHLPHIFQGSQKINRIADPYIRMAPEEFRSDINEIDKAPITNWIFLAPADKWSYSQLPREQFINKLQAALDLTHNTYHYYRRLSTMHHDYSLAQEHKILDHNIGDGPFHLATFSTTHNFKEQYLKLKDKISIQETPLIAENNKSSARRTMS